MGAVSGVIKRMLVNGKNSIICGRWNAEGTILYPLELFQDVYFRSHMPTTMTVLLRALTLADAPLLQQYANNPEIARRLTDAFPHPYTLEQAKNFIAKVNENQPRLVSAITVDGAFAGCVGVHPQGDIWAHNAELGYWLAEPFWGRGAMTEAVRQVVAYGWEAFPAVQRIFARPFGSNLGSARVLEKAGFELEARLTRTIFKAGVYEDELIYSIWRSHPQDK